MSKFKYAAAMLAAGGATVAASQASAAVTIETLNLSPYSDPLTEIKLAGSADAQFNYGLFLIRDSSGGTAGAKSQLTATSLGKINPTAFATGELPSAGETFSLTEVTTATLSPVGPPTVKSSNADGEAYYHLQFQSNGESYLGSARIGSDARLVSIAYDKAGAVPEPGAWALLIMGFGAAGAMLRQRRRAQPAMA